MNLPSSPRRRRTFGALALLSAALLPTAALGLDVPGIQGHMTDPGHKLSDGDKSSMEDRLSKIQEDTHIDFAGSISDVPEDQATAYGEAAFKSWGIGNDWDNGVFLIFPGSGRVHIVQNPDKPLLNGEELGKLAEADDPGEDLHRRIEKLSDKARDILVPKTANQVRPRGTAHPERGRYYAVLTALIALAGVGASFRRWRIRRAPLPPQPPSEPPAPSPLPPPSAPPDPGQPALTLDMDQTAR